MFCVYVSGWCGALTCHSCTLKKKTPKNSQHLWDDDCVSHIGYQGSTCRSWHPNLLPGYHVVSYFISTFLSWIEYCDYTRARGCLLSACLTLMYPRAVTLTVSWTVGHKKYLSINLDEVHKLFYSLFLHCVPEITSGVLVLPLWLTFTALFWNFLSVKNDHILINTKLSLYGRR